MADLSWHRKYRPSSFDDYMGENVKNTIVNRLKDRDSIPNTIMLYGTRGTGKTSMARLIAKEIHCMNPVDGHSCGECEMCKEIDQYITSTEAGAECFGITEVDAASTTGKGGISEIMEDAIQAPIFPLEHKIIILDECHQLSTAAQNSLLKIIEEPPPFLIFILCTTDPQKVIDTIHSRMQLKIEVRKKSIDEIVNKLTYIASQENLVTSPQALQIIAKKGDRIPRDCITLLEKVAKSNGNVVDINGVRAILEEVGTEIYIDYFKAANTSLESIMEFNKKLKDGDISIKTFTNGLVRFVLDACYVKHGVALDDFSIDFVKQAKELFKIYTSSEFDVLLQVVEQASRSVSDDDTKGELIITNTALRIGKIGLLAQGLGSEQRQAEKENTASLKNYKNWLSEDESRKPKLATSEPTKSALHDAFRSMVEVGSGITAESLGIGKKDTEIDLIASTTETSTPAQGQDSGFIDPDKLSGLLD